MAANLPYISFPMIIDALEPYKIIYVSPGQTHKRFKWVSSIHWEAGIISESDMLFVCQGKAVEEAMSLFPAATLIIVQEPNNPWKFERNGNPVIVVEKDDTTINLLQKLQNTFLAIQAWQNELAHITPAVDSFCRVLGKSARMLGVPMILYGSDYQPIAKALFNTNTPLCKEYLRREKEIVNSIRMIHRTPVVFKDTAINLVIENALIGNKAKDPLILIALFEKEPSQGRHDLFTMLVNILSNRPDIWTGKFEPIRYSFFSLFDDLVNERYISNRHLDSYASNIRIPLDAEFRLVCFKPYNASQRSDLNELAHLFKSAASTNSVSVVYEDKLYILFYSKGLDSSLSNKIIVSQLHPYFIPNKGIAVLSQVFNEITNMQFAYQQIKLVEKYQQEIDFSHWFTKSDQKEQPFCYTFEEALRFLIVDSEEMSPSLRDFSFSHTIIDKILAEDAANGRDDVRILATYLHYERKATVVAEKLHMHRNTVLYRIEKIEKRFGLDFNESWSRNRLLFDFSILYSKLVHNPELFRNVIGCSLEDLDLNGNPPLQ